MKLIHLSDLHLGKRVNEISMLEDQEYMLRQILEIVDAEAPQAVILAGDIYDKTVPPAEAVGLFDEFLYQLSQRRSQVYIISGNHDSAERIAFGGRLMGQSGIHVSPVYDGSVSPLVLEDEFGSVAFYLLPFVRPAHVRRFFPDAGIESYTDAIRTAIEHIALDREKRNVLVTHQFVTGAVRSDSEELSVGGSDNVDASVFEAFDYVALGHLHGPQKVGRETLRYCGSPLKYSFSEKDQEKSATVVELREKGTVEIRTAALRPLHDLREIRGSYNELMNRSFYDGTAVGDYLHIILTDEQDVPDAMARLRTVYPNAMKLDYDNTRTRSSAQLTVVEELERKSEIELFAEFYEKQNGQPMSDQQLRFSAELLEKIKEAMG